MVANSKSTTRPSLPTPHDVDLEHRLTNFLYARHVTGADTVQFDVRRGTVVVSGTLPSGTAKRLCLDCCQQVAGVIRLVDEVVVDSRPIDS